MEILAEKSAFDIAPLASETFAPTEVPERRSCFDKIYSLLLEKFSYALIQLYDSKRKIIRFFP